MRNVKNLFLIVLLTLFIAAAFLLLLRSNARQSNSEKISESGVENWEVDIVGFNYTNRLIDSYSVNGQGAGNVLLSSRTSGGGKSVCCIAISNAESGIRQVRVRWQVEGCTYLTRSKISGEIFDNIFPYYKHADLALPLPKNSKPQHLEVHFYPDGSVNAQLTESLSLPHMSMDGQRSDISNSRRCHEGKKPES